MRAFRFFSASSLLLAASITLLARDADRPEGELPRAGPVPSRLSEAPSLNAAEGNRSGEAPRTLPAGLSASAAGATDKAVLPPQFKGGPVRLPPIDNGTLLVPPAHAAPATSAEATSPSGLAPSVGQELPVPTSQAGPAESGEFDPGAARRHPPPKIRPQ
jgi:hypothetical protein